jgi:hypothetical protein
MKKTLTAMTLLAGAVSVYSQGVVSMQNYTGGFLGVQVYNVQTANTVTVTDGSYSGSEVMGNSSNTYNKNPGSAVYNTATKLGAGFDVALLGAAGSITSGDYAALTQAPGSLITSLISPTSVTPKAGGSWISTGTASVAGSGSTFTLALAAWQNSGSQGAATTLAAAQADGYAWGVSDMVTTTLATGINPPGTLPYGASGLTDFSLVPGASATPEPSTIALGVIGASALLFRRRK